jgi:putative Mg2+ transporter-C (MgtC) family protein
MIDEAIIQLQLLGKVCVAVIFAGMVGLERELIHKPAGLRTHMTIGGASCLLVLLGELLAENYEARLWEDALRVDPLRIIQAIIIGISFIGGGTILKVEAQERVRYLTSAASILFSAAIGISVALNQYVLALGSTLLVLFINYVMNVVWDKLFRKK